jgi:hypothetical protein
MKKYYLNDRLIGEIISIKKGAVINIPDKDDVCHKAGNGICDDGCAIHITIDSPLIDTLIESGKMVEIQDKWATTDDIFNLIEIYLWTKNSGNLLKQNELMGLIDLYRYRTTTKVDC